MRIDAAFPSTYLKAADLQGRNVTVVMDRVEMEDIGGDHKPVLYFQGKEKGLVLNKTNSTNISVGYGYETEDWQGKPLILFSAMVDFQGRSVEAIRVRLPRAADRITTGPQGQTAPPPRSMRETLPADDMDQGVPF